MKPTEIISLDDLFEEKFDSELAESIQQLTITDTSQTCKDNSHKGWVTVKDGIVTYVVAGEMTMRRAVILSTVVVASVLLHIKDLSEIVRVLWP